MRKVWGVTVLFAVMCAAAGAQTFTLRSEDGSLAGPIELKKGATCTIAGMKVVVEDVKTDEDVFIDRMKKIIIPEIDFRQADIHDVVDFLREASQEYCPDHKGVNIILYEGTPSPGYSSGNTTGMEMPGGNAFPLEAFPLITLRARDVNLWKTLEIVTEVAGLKDRVQDGVVKIMPLDFPEGGLKTRTYNILPTLNGGETTDWKQFFAEMGIEFPRGASVQCMPTRGVIIVTNTQENLKEFEKRLALLRVIPNQIDVELKIIAFKRSEIERLGPAGISADKLLKLWASGRGVLLAAPRVVTQSGMEAMVKGVTDLIYPSDFSLCQETNTVDSMVSTGPVPPVVPGDFTMRETGAVLSVLPEVSPDERLINLTLQPEYVEPPVWEEHTISVTDSNGVKRMVRTKQPDFHAYSATTSVSINSGETVLIGGGMPSRDGETMVYMFLSPRLVGADGKDLSLPYSEE